MRQGILLGERKTSVFNRLVARGIDLLVAVTILFLGKALWAPLGVFGACVFCAFADGLGEGQSVGKRILGMRVVDAQTGAPCEFGASAVRNLPFVLALILGAIPWLWLFFLVVAAPLIAVELYIVLTVDTGVRLGDVMANTQVMEYADEEMLQRIQ